LLLLSGCGLLEFEQLVDLFVIRLEKHLLNACILPDIENSLRFALFDLRLVGVFSLQVD